MIKKSLRKIFFYLLYFSLVHKIFKRSFKNKISIIYFHNIIKGKRFKLGILNPPIANEVFLKEMRYLKKNYHVLSLDECVDILKNKRKIKPYSVVLTFDDGYINHYKHVFPSLKKMGFPATFFINTASIDTQDLSWSETLEHLLMHGKQDSLKVKIDNQEKTFQLNGNHNREKILKNVTRDYFIKANVSKREDLLNVFKQAVKIECPQDSEWRKDYTFMTSPMVKEMQAQGMVIGGHTAKHAILANETYEDQEIEIADSKVFLKDSRDLHFCYPNGAAGDFNNETKTILQQQGFCSAVTTIAGFCDHKTDLFELHRLYAHPDFAEFVCTLSGIKVILNRLKTFIMKGKFN